MSFKIKARKGKARTGVLKTAHGEVETPNLAIVATHGNVRLLNKSDHKKAKLELIIANTFHLWVNKKVGEMKKAGGIHKWNGLKIPTMTDSGGFQVFSLGWGKVHGMGKVDSSQSSAISNQTEDGLNKVEITDDEAIFIYENKKFRLDAEKSMRIQRDIGADILFAFDECTSPLHNHAYNKKSLKKTHAWAERSLREHKKLQAKKKDYQQQLFGIVQGGIFEDLRKKSSKVIGAMDFDGFGIGGSFGEKQMKTVLGWALSDLPDEKPRHLLGIGRLKDIFTAVEQGIDLFDCVVPTREGRHGVFYTKEGRMNIRRSEFASDKKLLGKSCGCFVCKNKITRSELRQLFKSEKIKDKIKAQRFATIHNIYFYKNLFRQIRETIKRGKEIRVLQKEYNLR